MLSEVDGHRDRQGNEVDLDGVVVVASNSAPPSLKLALPFLQGTNR
jgi:hypothetical protein